ncbi:hypothetical protein ABLG96_03805 [Nakamurella sp. A5-74]|uniref:Uncharacterized protein n=1 Tax=Nakamurella sp. A5-74 TaxID=3158264 RepID=A0AAU8DQ91_9ACTN
MSAAVRAAHDLVPSEEILDAITVAHDAGATYEEILESIEILAEDQEAKAATAEQHPAREKARPFWQTMDCPSWCDAEHAVNSRRVHQSNPTVVWCTRATPEAGTDTPTAIQFHAWVSQQDLHRDPLIYAGHNNAGEYYQPLTVAEARMYAAQLLRQADIAEGIDRDRPGDHT